MKDAFTRKIVKSIVIYFVFILLFIILSKTVFMLSAITSSSMEPTLMTDDVVLADRLGVKENDIKRYDILIFIPPDKPDTTYIKRVIGLPGETIEVSDGRVYADGVALDDSFLNMPMLGDGDGVYEVPEGCFFFLGDNRNDSLDSRFWEEKYIPAENIKAKAKFILFPFNRTGTLEYEEEEWELYDVQPCMPEGLMCFPYWEDIAVLLLSRLQEQGFPWQIYMF